MRRRTNWLKAYRLVWSGLYGLVGVLGLLAGLFFVPTDLVFPLFFVASLIGSAVGANAWSKTADASVPARAWKAAVVAATVIAAVVACAGYVVLLGPAGPSLVVILGVTSPPAMRWFGRRLGHVPGRLYNGALTTAELCTRWQDSYDALRAATTAAARLRIVEARQHYLDELERRDPRGLNAWLGKNASAAGDPSRFLAGDDGRDSR
ncbi:hypothetical protein ACIBG5_05060 [Kribbella sp. NPDC050241]|uniref:hypothetical protein n=1 Tax=Kribbella sp. NPDC050241 TaxID=3364115 RepID=UPI0037A2A7BC